MKHEVFLGDVGQLSAVMFVLKYSSATDAAHEARPRAIGGNAAQLQQTRLRFGLSLPPGALPVRHDQALLAGKQPSCRIRASRCALRTLFTDEETFMTQAVGTGVPCRAQGETRDMSDPCCRTLPLAHDDATQVSLAW